MNDLSKNELMRPKKAAETLMVIQHGSKYFEKMGVMCPECGSLDYSIQQGLSLAGDPAEGIYYFDCRHYCYRNNHGSHR
jgi:hypothetical protein